MQWTGDLRRQSKTEQRSESSSFRCFYCLASSRVQGCKCARLPLTQPDLLGGKGNSAALVLFRRTCLASTSASYLCGNTFFSSSAELSRTGGSVIVLVCSSLSLSFLLVLCWCGCLFFFRLIALVAACMSIRMCGFRQLEGRAIER